MNVLDIDLDFFLDKTVDGRSDDPANRPDEYGIVPWSVADVTDFLENTLNVGMNNSGAVVQSHHEVFYQWKNLIEARELVVPFKVVHVDAHSDLGLGCLSSTYLHSEFLSIEVSNRPKARYGRDGINFGSFLAFAFGCRWISEADFVINHNWHDDIPRHLLSQESYELVEERAPTSVLPYGDYELEIEIMRTSRSDDGTITWDIMEERKSIGEPTVPFNIVSLENVGARYSDTKWDYVFLSHSPGYVPSYADHLLEQIGKYIGNSKTHLSDWESLSQ